MKLIYVIFFTYMEKSHNITIPASVLSSLSHMVYEITSFLCGILVKNTVTLLYEEEVVAVREVMCILQRNKNNVLIVWI